MNSQTRERASQLFGALSHPMRLHITELLCQGERKVNEIASALGLSQSGTSQHLAILTRAGLLVVEPRGTVRVHRVRGPRIGHILTLIEEFCHVNHLYGVPAEAGEVEAGEEGAGTSSTAP